MKNQFKWRVFTKDNEFIAKLKYSIDAAKMITSLGIGSHIKNQANDIIYIHENSTVSNELIQQRLILYLKKSRQ